jgi:hypothetical protein
VAHVRHPRGKPVLRRDAAHRDMHGLAKEEFFRATERASQIEATLL